MATSLRTAAAVLTGAIALVLATTALARTPALYQGALTAHSKVTCNHTGVSGPTGKVTGLAYALKGAHPARAALSCARVQAVLRAGRGDMFTKLASSAGRRLTVRGTRYTVREFIGVGASGPAPAFVGGGSVVIAQYASGR